MAEQKKIKTSKIRKVKIEEMTVNEFRAKLEGIEMFQDESWAPSKEQWDLIREMINYVQETVEIERVSMKQNSSQYKSSNNQTSDMPRPREMSQPPMVDHAASSLVNITDPTFITSIGEASVPVGVGLVFYLIKNNREIING